MKNCGITVEKTKGVPVSEYKKWQPVSIEGVRHFKHLWFWKVFYKTFGINYRLVRGMGDIYIARIIRPK